MKSRIAIVSVISDVYTDQRVLRTAEVLKELNYEVLIIGRRVTSFISHIQPDYTIYHIQPVFKKTAFMYAVFNFLLLCKLFFLGVKHRKKHVLLYANDLDTLLPNYIISKIFSLHLVYDSHEIFTEVPELQHKPFRKKIWECIEKSIVPKLPFAITVNESIARWYQKKYPIPFYAVRNISAPIKVDKLKNRSELNLPDDKKILILQGTGINIHRGAEELTEAMQYLNDNYVLLIIGGGDVIDVLKQKANEWQLNQKIIFKDRMPAEELYHYTCNADLGISIDKPNNLNYHYSLPNKIFSYIHAHIPILSSRLPEIEKIIYTYQIGNFIDNHQPQHIAQKIEETLNSPEYARWKANTFKAEQELKWEKEKEKLKSILRQYINH
ncbi:MAG: glycosyltransferase [Bacteroidia bacterium]|nr:MAG: glycosyltransferase [Bacteroidia bacterium]